MKMKLNKCLSRLIKPGRVSSRAMAIAVMLSMNACGGGGGESGVGDAMVAGQSETWTATAHASVLSKKPVLVPPKKPVSALFEEPVAVPSEKPVSTPYVEPVTTYHPMQHGDETLALAATAGMVPVEGASEDARIVYVAYTQRDAEPSSRPITFFLGDSVRDDPLRSAGYLLLASVGPIVGGLSGQENWDRYDNLSTLLDTSDLVFVHPIESGSHGDFWGNLHAGRAAMRFIDTYLDTNHRRGSPVYLVTHGARVAGHALDLLKTRPHGFAGMAFISPVLGPDGRAEHREPPAEISWELGVQWLVHLDGDLDFDVARYLSAEFDRLRQPPYGGAGDVQRYAHEPFFVQGSEAPPWSANRLVDALPVADAPRLFIAYGSDVQKQAFSSELSSLNAHPAQANRIKVESYRGFPEGDSRRDLFYLDEVSRMRLRIGLQWLYASRDEASVDDLSHNEKPSRTTERSDALPQERDGGLELGKVSDTTRDPLADSVLEQQESGISTPHQSDRDWLDPLSNPFLEGLSEDECLERACKLSSALLQEAENCLQTGTTSDPKRRQSTDSVFAQDDGASNLLRTSVSESTACAQGDTRRRGSRLTPIRVVPEATSSLWHNLPTPPASPEK